MNFAGQQDIRSLPPEADPEAANAAREGSVEGAAGPSPAAED
jgi:hypothetical protein